MERNACNAKYVHIIFRNEVKFSHSLVNFINEPSIGLYPEQHIFITPHKMVYEKLKDYGNVFLDTSDVCLINKYAPMCSWVICHGHFKSGDIFKIKNKYLSKVLYRYWGGNFGFEYKKGQLIQNFVKFIANIELRRRFNKFAAIGIANNVDVLSLKHIFKTDKFYKMPYARVEIDEILNRVKADNIKKDGILNIALYHRGTVEGNHIEILKKLSRFGNKIRVYVPISYGDEEYIETVKKYIKEESLSNVIVIDEFMTYENYVKLINTMDIGIFDCVTSTALGNVAIYLFLEKKLFLNGNGIIKKAFDEENIPHDIVTNLDTMSFEELAKSPDYPENMQYDLMPLGKTQSIEVWRKIMEDFN